MAVKCVCVHVCVCVYAYVHAWVLYHVARCAGVFSKLCCGMCNYVVLWYGGQVCK